MSTPYIPTGSGYSDHTVSTDRSMSEQSDELSKLKQEMLDLKSRLNQQEIINESTILRVIRHNISWIKRYHIFQATVLLPIVCVCFLYLVFAGICSWGLYIATVLIVGASVTANFVIAGGTSDNITTLTVKDMLLKLYTQKKRSYIKILISLPLIVIWFVFFSKETISDTFLFISALTGGITGGIMGFTIFLKYQRTLSNSIKELEDFVSNIND